MHFFNTQQFFKKNVKKNPDLWENKYIENLKKLQIFIKKF